MPCLLLHVVPPVDTNKYIRLYARAKRGEGRGRERGGRGEEEGRGGALRITKREKAGLQISVRFLKLNGTKTAREEENQKVAVTIRLLMDVVTTTTTSTTSSTTPSSSSTTPSSSPLHITTNDAGKGSNHGVGCKYLHLFPSNTSTSMFLVFF
jgi:hypothetical protein